MSKKFCWTDKAVEYIFHRIESFPEYVFAESELARQSLSGFNSLKDLKLLKWKQFDWEHELFVSHIPGDIGTVRYLRQNKNGKYWAHPEEDEAKSRIEVEEKDLPHWVFDVKKIVDIIRTSNQLSGKQQEWNNRLAYLGGYSFPNQSVGIAVALYDCDEGAENILSVKWEDYGHSRIVVLCPTFSFKDPLKAERCRAREIDIVTFKDAVTESGFGLNLKAKDDAQLSYRNLAEKKDYGKYKYKSLDEIEFLDKKSGHSSYSVKINNAKTSIPNAVFSLLLFLAISLKKDKEGYVTKAETDKEGITDENRTNHLDDLVYELRNKIAPLIKTTDRDGIIQVDNGRYRLSIHSNRIKEPKKGWVDAIYLKVLTDLDKKREKRSNQSGRQDYKKAIRKR
ncbi:MAG: hypothetical protein ABII75_09885 [Candidatus Omnitrophota bacterium]